MNLPALREIGFSANRRLLRVQRLDHDPITAANALHTITNPITTETGTRVPGLRLGLQPDGFRNTDIRALLAQLRGLPDTAVSSGQTTCDACACTD